MFMFRLDMAGYFGAVAGAQQHRMVHAWLLHQGLKCLFLLDFGNTHALAQVNRRGLVVQSKHN
jgi:hypothetical protein